MEFKLELKNDREYVLEAVKQNGFNLEHVSEELKNDKEVVLEAVKQNGFNLKHASEELKNDKEFILEAVKEDGWSLQFASLELQNDKEVVLEAVKQNGFSLECACFLLQYDEEVVLEAVKQNGRYLRRAKVELNDKEVVLEAVKLDGESIKFASLELRNDKEFILDALKQDGFSLEYASLELRSDKEVVLEAVKQNGDSLRYASSELRNNKEVVLEAVKQNSWFIQHASLELQNDKEFILELVKQNGFSLEYASYELRNDKEVVLEAVKQNGLYLEYSSSELQNNKEILLARSIEKLKVSTKKFSVGVSKTPIASFEGIFNDLVFHLLLGRGAYGGTYLCTRRKRSRSKKYAVKIYNNLFYGTQKKVEILSRDCLYIPPQENVVRILKHWTKQTIDLFKFPDYEKYWKDKTRGKRYIPNCGVILMNYYETTLNKYLDARIKENKRFGITEIRRMFWGLLCGLCHLYKNMIVHRDLHGDNIFVDPIREEILIGDFGCCLDLRKNKTGFKVHKDHELMFSFTNDSYFKRQHNSECGFKKGGYLKMIPPEIQNFDPSKDEFLDYSKSDIYSLGVLGFILLDHLEKGEDDFGLSEFMKKIVTEDQEKRLGCFEAMEIGKFIEV